MIAVLMTVVVLAGAGCGRPAQESDRSTATGSPSAGVHAAPSHPPVTASASARNTSAGTAPEKSGPEKPAPATTKPGKTGGSVLIRWIRRYTPTGGGGSRYEGVYVALMQGDCGYAYGLARGTDGEETNGGMLEEPVRSTFEGAAAACLAAFDGQAQLWSVAARLAAAVQPGGLTCWEREVYDVVVAAVRAHQANPDARLRRGDAGAASRCPALTGIHPEHGSRAGGFQVVLSGRNLPGELELELLGDGQPVVTATANANGDLEFTMPPSVYGVGEIAIRPLEQPRGAGSEVNFGWDD